MSDCVFCKIAKKEISKEFTYEDEDVMVFEDLYPVKPIHVLIVPKKHIVDFSDVTDPVLIQKLWSTINRLTGQLGLTKKGVRILVNSQGAQVVPHLHIHLMGPMGHNVTE